MSERHFVWGPRSRWAEGPGIKEKGLGKWWKQLFIFCHFLRERRVTPWTRFTEIGRCICGLRGLVSFLHPTVPKRASGNTAASFSARDPQLSEQHLLFRRLQWRGIESPHVSAFHCFCHCSQPNATAVLHFWVFKFAKTVLGLKYAFTVTCFVLVLVYIQ